MPRSPSSRRAWIEMTRCAVAGGSFPASPSSRRAWIEIDTQGDVFKDNQVALLAEGVDRNAMTSVPLPKVESSPSSRRAWIEILNSTGTPNASPSPSSRRAWIEIYLSRAI